MKKSHVGFLARLSAVLALVAVLSLLGSAQTAVQSDSEEALAQSGWQNFPMPPDYKATMYALDMVDSTDGWTGGQDGFMMRYVERAPNVFEWVGVPTPFGSLINAIDMVSESSGWGVTYQGQVIRYDGSGWDIFVPLSDASLNDVFMVGENDGWIVDLLGRIYRYSGGSWNQIASFAPSLLQAIDMLGPNDGWIVGSGGIFLHWNGYFWARVGMGAPVFLLDVDMVHSTDGWAVGTGGAIYHYDGSDWMPVQSPTTEDLWRVDMLPGGGGWAVGTAGTILYYNGQSWQQVDSPTNKDLYALHMLSDVEGWALGKFGAVLKWSGSPPDISQSSSSASAYHALPGEQLTYTINVRNTGDNPAPGVVMTDTIPSGTTYVPGSASATQGSISGPDPLVVTLGDVAPESEATITFRVELADLGPGCWFVHNEAIITMEGTQLIRQTTTSVNDCQRTYLPLVERD